MSGKRWALLCRSCRRRGFTLIELLLVMAIIGLVAAVTVPNLVRSIQGNRLRAATRTVVMAGRYARSMSLLNQKEMELRFDKSAGRVSIHEVTAGGPRLGPEEDAAFGEGGARQLGPVALAEAPVPEGEGEAPPGGIARELDRVSIDYVQLEDGKAGALVEPVTTVVRYRSNGTCTPYAVRLVDESGAAVIVRVDMLAGVVTEGM